MSFKSWLLTSSLENAHFFTNIRELARSIHSWIGHRWAEHIASCSVVGDVYEVKIRTCIDCNAKEMMNENGEWIPRE